MRLAGCRVAMTIPATGNASSTTATAIAMTRSALPLPRLSGFLRSRVAHAVTIATTQRTEVAAKTAHASRLRAGERGLAFGPFIVRSASSIASGVASGRSARYDTGPQAAAESQYDECVICWTWVPSSRIV